MTEHATGMSGHAHAPPWVDELVSILAWPAFVAVWLGVTGLIGSSWLIVLLPASILAWGILCLGVFARSDPLGFASIVVPPLGVAAAVSAIEIAGGDPAIEVVLIPSVWVLTWSVAGSRLWPAWSRTVLRRYRPDSPEVQLHRSWQELSRMLRSWSTPEQGQAIWTGILALERWQTPRTRRVIDSLFAYWELVTTAGVDAARTERVVRRSGEEWARMWAPPRLRLPKREPDPFDRPTRGTRLEYLFPMIEALLAVATPEQRRRIAVESARLAIRDTGMTDAALEAALDEAARGETHSDAPRPTSAW